MGSTLSVGQSEEWRNEGTDGEGVGRWKERRTSSESE